MKKLLIFLGLKIAETLAFMLVIIKCPSWLGRWMHTWTHYLCTPTEHCPDWCVGFISILLTLTFTGISILIIRVNWVWAEDLS